MSGSQKLQIFQGILVIVGICIILLRCLPLIKELKEYKGVSARTGRHDLIRVYQIILKPWGLVLTFFLIYFCLRMMYVCTYDKQQVVFYDYWPGMIFGFAAGTLCLPFYEMFERLILMKVLKQEYLDYAFLDVSWKAKPEKPLKRDEIIEERSPFTRFLHYCSLFLVVTLCAFFIAAGYESMSFYRAICSDKIYEARPNDEDVILPYKQITAITQDTEYTDLFVVYGSTGQIVNITDINTLEYLVEQSGIQVQYAK